jgi:hypothetical protein
MEHFPGHQQALIKNNLVIAVLVFNEHNIDLMNQTFRKFEYDEVVDLCKVNLSAGLGDSWDGLKFHIKQFQSWTLNKNNSWDPPIKKPEGNYYWNEEAFKWEEIQYPEDCNC